MDKPVVTIRRNAVTVQQVIFRPVVGANAVARVARARLQVVPTQLSPRPIAEPGAYDGPNPYVAYAKAYTREGGVEITYRTVNLSGWLKLFQWLGWLLLIGAAAWFLVEVSPFSPLPPGCHFYEACRTNASGESVFLNLLALVVLAVLLSGMLGDIWCLRSIEIRCDRMILDGAEVFWAFKFETMPRFREDANGLSVLTAIYGNRQTDLLHVKQSDENDRTPTVLANHIQAAIKQLWYAPRA